MWAVAAQHSVARPGLPEPRLADGLSIICMYVCMYICMYYISCIVVICPYQLYKYCTLYCTYYAICNVHAIQHEGLHLPLLSPHIYIGIYIHMQICPIVSATNTTTPATVIQSRGRVQQGRRQQEHMYSPLHTCTLLYNVGTCIYIDAQPDRQTDRQTSSMVE